MNKITGLSKILFLLFLFLILKENLFSQNKLLTNYEALKNSYSGISEKIMKDIPEGTSGINLNIEGDSNKWIFQNYFTELLKIKNLLSYGTKDSTVIKVKIFNETKIRYSNYPDDDDKFIRDMSCFCLVSWKDNQKTYTDNYSDTLNINDMQFINNEKIKTNAGITDEKSFFDTLLKPLVILSSTGILVYLLFTVRSK